MADVIAELDRANWELQRATRNVNRAVELAKLNTEGLEALVAAVESWLGPPRRPDLELIEGGEES